MKKALVFAVVLASSAACSKDDAPASATASSPAAQAAPASAPDPAPQVASASAPAAASTAPDRQHADDPALASASAPAAHAAPAAAPPSATGSAKSAKAAPACGDKPLPPCPLYAWMKANTSAAMSAEDFDALATALDKAATFAPAGYTNWVSIAKDGASAAHAQSLDGVKASCRGCHNQYKDKYKKEMRDRPI
jgi:hypothetical protein